MFFPQPIKKLDQETWLCRTHLDDFVHTLTSSTFSLLGIEREIKKYLPKLGKGNWHEMFSIPVLGKRNLKWVSTSYTLGSETGSIFFLPFNQEEKFEIKLHFKLGNFRNLYKCILSIFRKILFSFILNIKIWPKPSLSSKKMCLWWWHLLLRLGLFLKQVGKFREVQK